MGHSWCSPFECRPRRSAEVQERVGLPLQGLSYAPDRTKGRAVSFWRDLLTWEVEATAEPAHFP